MKAIALGVLYVVLCCTALAQESACVFAANQSATVQIEYRYRTPEGEGLQNGSGFIVAPSGFVITNAHVVSPRHANLKVEGASVSVRAGGLVNPPVEAEVVFRDPANDLALLRLPMRSKEGGWPVVTVGSAANLPVGSRLMGLGFAVAGDIAIVPWGEKTANNTVVDGQLRPWWQTSLALNPGNSGGPIFDQLGTVVGVAVAINSTAQLVNYVIPISRAQHLLDLAEVKTSVAGRCAVFPECRHASHGVERYEKDSIVNRWGNWRRGGYNQGAFCNDFLADLQRAHPQSTFTFVKSDERSRMTWDRHAEYKYYCEFRRQEQPLFEVRRSIACLR